MPASSYERYVQARRATERRTGSRLAEGVILVVAYLLAYAWIARNAARVDGGTWAGQMQDGALALTLAGWWALLVALPLFWFLLGRWLWRFVTWGRLLRDIAACELRLVATHPDRCGGIAFIGQYPKSYVLFVFALSSVVVGQRAQARRLRRGEPDELQVRCVRHDRFPGRPFVLPLLAFSPVLKALKRRGLSHYGALVSRHNLAFEAKWVGGTAGRSRREAERWVRPTCRRSPTSPRATSR